MVGGMLTPAQIQRKRYLEGKCSTETNGSSAVKLGFSMLTDSAGALSSSAYSLAIDRPLKASRLCTKVGKGPAEKSTQMERVL